MVGRWLVVFFVAAVGATACAQIAGLGDYGEAAASGGASAGGGAATDETCTNGLDDDEDGAIDCADDDCADFACLPAVPPDFDGPLLVQTGPEALSCSIGTKAFDGGIGPPLVPDASCVPCSCEASGGCVAELVTYSKGSCDTVTQVVPVASGCTDVSLQQVTSFNAQPSMTTLMCVASGGEATLEPPSWDEHVTACLLPAGGGCDGDVCVPLDESSDRCIHAPGDVPCPTGDYSERRVVEVVVKDDRRCAACTCEGSDETCEGSLELYELAGCSGPADYDISVPNICLTPQPEVDVGSLLYTPTQPGTCSPNTTQPEGGVTTETRTLCCIP